MFLAALTLTALLSLSSSNCRETEQPKVVRAVSPFYSAVPASAGMQGEVQIEATVDSEGKVSAVRTIIGNKLLAADATRAVQRWLFEPSEDKSRSRTVKLIFRFTLVSADSPLAETTSVFLPPSSMEVRAVRPVLAQPSDDRNSSKMKSRRKTR